MKLLHLPLIAGLALAASPAMAENWMLTTVVFTDGSQLYVDADTVKRNWQDTNKITYRIRVQGYQGSADARISGNCSTGKWRMTSNRSNGLNLILSDDTGAQALRYACMMPYTLTQPRVTQPRAPQIR